MCDLCVLYKSSCIVPCHTLLIYRLLYFTFHTVRYGPLMLSHSEMSEERDKNILNLFLETFRSQI